MANYDELAALRAENARLIGLLEAHCIPWRDSAPPVVASVQMEPSRFCTEEKIALFRRRRDVYPHPALLRTWAKRQRAYRAMGHRIDYGYR